MFKTQISTNFPHAYTQVKAFIFNYPMLVSLELIFLHNFLLIFFLFLPPWANPGNRTVAHIVNQWSNGCQKCYVVSIYRYEKWMEKYGCTRNHIIILCFRRQTENCYEEWRETGEKRAPNKLSINIIWIEENRIFWWWWYTFSLLLFNYIYIKLISWWKTTRNFLSLFLCVPSFYIISKTSLQPFKNSTNQVLWNSVILSKYIYRK